LLTKLREVIAEKITYPIARRIAILGISPNTITIVGFLIAILYLPLMAYGKPLLALLVIILSGIMDILDGAVAKVTGKTTKLGSFLDSTLDRIEDIIFIFGLRFLKINDLLIYTFLTLSLMISYMRAKGESLGLRVEGRGIIERAERIILIALMILFSTISYNTALTIMYLAIILSLISFTQRFYFITKSLKRE